VIDSAAILFQPDQNASIFWSRQRGAIANHGACDFSQGRNIHLWSAIRIGISTIEIEIGASVLWRSYAYRPQEKKMRKIALVLLASLAATPALAQPKDCDELKAEIDAKITANGVATFTTSIVDKDAAEDGEVVGTCDAGAKKIVYKRG
jgi:hypothetical protein